MFHRKICQFVHYNTCFTEKSVNCCIIYIFTKTCQLLNHNTHFTKNMSICMAIHILRKTDQRHSDTDPSRSFPGLPSFAAGRRSDTSSRRAAPRRRRSVPVRDIVCLFPEIRHVFRDFRGFDNMLLPK